MPPDVKRVVTTGFNDQDYRIEVTDGGMTARRGEHGERPADARLEGDRDLGARFLSLYSS